VAQLAYAAWFVEEEWEAGVTLAGAAVLIAAHAINRALCRRCPQCELASACGHTPAGQ
jgi:hypothetical protein